MKTVWIAEDEFYPWYDNVLDPIPSRSYYKLELTEKEYELLQKRDEIVYKVQELFTEKLSTAREQKPGEL